MRRTVPCNSVCFLFRALGFSRNPRNLAEIVPEFEDPFIREIVVRSYRVVYRLDNSRHLVEVIRFWHAARDTPDIW